MHIIILSDRTIVRNKSHSSKFTAKPLAFSLNIDCFFISAQFTLKGNICPTTSRDQGVLLTSCFTDVFYIVSDSLLSWRGSIITTLKITASISL